MRRLTFPVALVVAWVLVIYWPWLYLATVYAVAWLVWARGSRVCWVLK